MVAGSGAAASSTSFSVAVAVLVTCQASARLLLLHWLASLMWLTAFQLVDGGIFFKIHTNHCNI